MRQKQSAEYEPEFHSAQPRPRNSKLSRYVTMTLTVLEPRFSPVSILNSWALLAMKLAVLVPRLAPVGILDSGALLCPQEVGLVSRQNIGSRTRAASRHLERDDR
jgi:hypothetical protein